MVENTDEGGQQTKQISSRLTGWTLVNRDGTFYIGLRPNRLDWYENYLTAAPTIGHRAVKDSSHMHVLSAQYDVEFATLRHILHREIVRYEQQQTTGHSSRL